VWRGGSPPTAREHNRGQRRYTGRQEVFVTSTYQSQHAYFFDDVLSPESAPPPADTQLQPPLPPVEPQQERKRKKRGFPVWLLVMMGVVLMVGSVGYIAYSTLVPPVPNATKDMKGNWVVPEDDDGLGVDTSAQTELPGQRLIVPQACLSANDCLDVPLGAMNQVDNIINPPGFYTAFWVRNLGTSLKTPEEGTVYIAAHSLRHGGVGPGNYLIDIDNETARVPEGALIEADGVRYRMTEWRSVPKPDLPKEKDIWEDVPGRIVLITCLQRPDNSASRNNILIIGMLENMPTVSATPSASASATASDEAAQG
jgi:hypothetical protein